MSIAKHFAASSLLLLGLQSVAASGADRAGSVRPEAVSPGRLDRIVEMGDGCFGYSWSTLEGARGFELEVHRVDGVAADVETSATPALRVRVPATLSWTPSLEECLRPGRYAWLVRAQTAAGWTEWSEPRLFEVRAPAEPPSESPRSARPTPAAAVDGRPPAVVELRNPSGERLFTAAPQPPRPLTGAAFAPPSCSGIFSDVTGSNPNCAWIEQLAADEIAQPCEDNGIFGQRFCPDQPVTRGQIAGLLERAMRGTDSWRAEQGDGAVSSLPPAPAGLHSVDIGSNFGNDVGQHTSITIGRDGLGLISYYDTIGALTVAHCSNIDCTEATITPIEFTSLFAYYTSITIGADGFGLISYYDASNKDLEVAHCANIECTTVDAITPLDTDGDVGQYTSITIGSDGLGLIAYFDATMLKLKVAHCANPQCSAAAAITAYGAIGIYKSISITIGADGLGLISYHKGDASPGLAVAHCSNENCSAANITQLASFFGPTPGGTSITVGADALGLISYNDTFGQLVAAHCSNTACTQATLSLLDTVGVGSDNSITIGTDGLGLISYYDPPNGDLKVAHCADTNCTAANLARLDTAGVVGRYNSITIGADGLGLISYYDATNGDLKVAHCSNVLCTPYFRRR